MDYTKDITNHQKGKHFSLGDRRELQGILSDSSKQYSLRQLAKYFNCAPNTIRNELKHGYLKLKKLKRNRTLEQNSASIVKPANTKSPLTS